MWDVINYQCTNINVYEDMIIYPSADPDFALDKFC